MLDSEKSIKSQACFKRMFDVYIASIVLMGMMPILVFVALMIKLTSKGSVFFRHKRVGLNNKEFYLLKFRTMSEVKDQESRFDIGDKSRVTSIGKILRATKLDEIPQLLNVIKGEISLVGPRPEIRKWVDVYPERWETVLKVKPGITDKASIFFRSEEEILSQSDNPEETYRNMILPRKLDYYEDYVSDTSFFNDLKLILLTLCVILFKNINLNRMSKINGK